MFIVQQAGAERVAALDARAQALGLSVGQTLADARALAPAIVCVRHDPAADARALKRLARGAGRFSPSVTPVYPDTAQGIAGHGLYLETEGVTHLFGGEEAWLAALLQRLQRAGFTAQGAVADTPGQAYGLAVFAPTARRGVVAPPGTGEQRLAGMPAAALRLPPAVLTGLSALGLKTVQQITNAPRASLARRFGAGLMAQIDAARGTSPEALSPAQPPPQASARLIFAQPLISTEALEAVCTRLSTDLSTQLQRLGLGARRLVLTLYRVDAHALTLTCAAARPTQDPARLARLLKERLARAGEGLDLGFGVDGAALNALRPQALDARATGALVGDAGDGEGALEGLAERLAARLGAQAVFAVAPRASHCPERAQRFACALSPGEQAWPPGPERPPLLLKRPEAIEAMAAAPDGAPAQFRWRRVLHRVARAQGPERIGAEWWLKAAPTRDYYRVETSEGRRYWVFRHGLFERETNTPSWFVHGCWP